MAGRDYTSRGIDVIDDLYHEIDILKQQVTYLQNIKQPTVPIYPTFTTPNPGDLPDDPIEGQSAIGQDDDVWWWYSNREWHSGATEPVKVAAASSAMGTTSSGGAFTEDFDPDDIISIPTLPTTGVSIDEDGVYIVSMHGSWTDNDPTSMIVIGELLFQTAPGGFSTTLLDQHESQGIPEISIVDGSLISDINLWSVNQIFLVQINNSPIRFEVKVQSHGGGIAAGGTHNVTTTVLRLSS